MVRGGPRFGHRHEVLSLVAVGWLDIPDDRRSLVAAGVATHHRDWSFIRTSYGAAQERDALLSHMNAADAASLRRWLEGDGAPDLARLGFAPLPRLRDIDSEAALLDALRELNDLAMDVEDQTAIDKLALTARAVRGLVLLADHAGSAHERLREPGVLNTPAALRAAVPFLAQPLPHHQAAAAQTTGHCLLTAPTGSGKTEAALLWAARQREVSRSPRSVFYVLPYRASLNAMHARMKDKYCLTDDDVVLQHSSSTTSLYTQLLDRKTYTPAQAARTAIRNKALGRLMTAPVRVLTPYQLLRGFFGLKGHEAVLTDATQGIFILDELHAYDPERLALILTAVRHLAKDLGATFMAMSATFPSVLSTLLRDVLDETVQILADQQTRDEAKRHVLRIADRDLSSDETLDDIAHRQQAGEAVLVVATTVARAQDVNDMLANRVGQPNVSLLHGRFTGDDRAKKEAVLMTRVANGRDRQGEPGTILVATQVVEVSLDVDFDALFTDPAPIEALVQRFGRVNRARRQPLRDVVVHTAIPKFSDRIYGRDPITRALEILTLAADAPIAEEAVQAWVDASYEPIAAALASRVRKQMQEFQRAVVETNRPLESHEELKELFDQQFDGIEVVPLSLRAEHERRVEEEPLGAPGLRVPISKGQWFRLRGAGLLIDNDYVACPYDPERGLDLSLRVDDDS